MIKDPKINSLNLIKTSHGDVANQYLTNHKLVALLLPSKGRIIDLVLTIFFTSLKAPDGLRVRFFIVANYNSIQLYFLKFFFSRHATFVDERIISKRGVNGAYNYAFEEAKKHGASWVVLWADDLIPESKSWLSELNFYLSKKDFCFGIFSTDEGNHKGFFGWNIQAGYPCAHFFVASVNSLPDYLLNPALIGFTGDNEIAISTAKKNIPIELLPIKVIHQPTANSTRSSRSGLLRSDLDTLYLLHPELLGQLDEIVMNGNLTDKNFRIIKDEGLAIIFDKKANPKTFGEAVLTWKTHRPPFKFQIIYFIRLLWNRLARIPITLKNWYSRNE